MLQADPSTREPTSPTQHLPEQSRAPGPTVTRTFYLILFPRELEDEVVQALEQLGLPGYTEFAKLTGRGPRGRHFDNPVWPGSEGSIFTVVGPEDGARLRVAIAKLSSEFEGRSRGLYGLHLLAWPCEHVL